MRTLADYHHRVTIENPTENRTVGGSQSFSWAVFGERWGRVVPKGSREYLNAQSAATDMDWLWEILGHIAITTKMRLVFDGRYFNILGVQDPDGKSPDKADVLMLSCREGPTRVNS